MQLLHYWREFTIILLLAVLAAFYYTTKSVDCPPPVVSVPVSREEDTTTKVTKVTKKPSGAVITETTETVKSTKEKSKTVTPTYSSPYKYSLGIYASPADYKHVRIDAGARLGALPIEAVAGFDLKYYELSIGVRLNF